MICVLKKIVTCYENISIISKWYVLSMPFMILLFTLNKKILQGLPQTAKLLTHDDLLDLSGTVECELPNRHLYDFVGNIRPSGRL